MYHDGHLEWDKGTLSLKAQDNANAGQKIGKKTLKYDFSFANWGDTTEQWLKGVRKRYTALFPEVSKQARIMASIKIKPTDSGTESSGSASGSNSSGRDLDSDYEWFGKGSDRDDNPQNNDHDADAGNHGSQRSKNKADTISNDDGGDLPVGRW